MYIFRAWIDSQGSNTDRYHVEGGQPFKDLRLWDLNTEKGRNIIRVVRRRHPLFFKVFIGRKYRTCLRIGSYTT